MQILYCNRMSSHYFSPFCLWFTTTGQQQPWYHLLTRYLHSPPCKSDKWTRMKRRSMMSFCHFLELGTRMLRATLHALKTTNSTTTFFSQYLSVMDFAMQCMWSHNSAHKKWKSSVTKAHSLIIPSPDFERKCCVTGFRSASSVSCTARDAT